MESSQFGVFTETRFPDYQIVIIVDYDDGRMFPLTEDCPKCLLPIANRKLLAYQLDLLKKCGAREIFVVSPQDYVAEVSKFLSEYLSEELIIELVAVSDMMGSADGLRALRDRLRGDFIIWNSDFISQVTLGEMAYKHRLQGADLTVLLASPPVDESAEGGKKSKGAAVPTLVKIDQEDAEYIALNNHGRLLMKTPVLEVDSVVSVSKALLGRSAGGAEGFSLHTNLLDTGVYIMSHWLLELVVNSDHISSLRTDLVPYIVNRQFQPAAHLMESLPGLKHRRRPLHDLEPFLSGVTATTPSPYMPLLRRNVPLPSMDMDVAHTSLGRDNSAAHIVAPPPYPVDTADILRCFAVIAPAATPNTPLLCQRITSIPSYVALNRDLPKQYTQADSPWGRVANYRKKELSTVGDNTTIADKVTFKLCSIGNNVKIGAKSKVNSSVIMENVIIGDNCVIQNSVICSGAVIENNCHMNDCSVGSHSRVSEGSKLKSETIASSTVS